MRGAHPPELIVLGAMKCGTSSLHYYLDLHPEVSMTRRKELNFFIDPEPVAPGVAPDQRVLMQEESTASRGLDWYRSQFDADVPVRGESSTAYSFPWYPNVAERIHAASPGVRLIFVMRHPLERALSHHRQFAVRDRRPPAEALLAPGNPYVAASSYATTLAPFLERFPRERLLLLRHEDLLMRRRQTLGQVFSFLGVDSGFYSSEMERELNRSAAKGPFYSRLERLRAERMLPVVERIPRRARVGVQRLLGGRPAPPSAGLEADAATLVLDRLSPDVERIEQLTGWSLADWRRAALPTPA